MTENVLNFFSATPFTHGLMISFQDSNEHEVIMPEQEYRNFFVMPVVADLGANCTEEQNEFRVRKVCGIMESYLSGLNDAVLNSSIKERDAVSTYASLKDVCEKMFGGATTLLGLQYLNEISSMETRVQSEQSKRELSKLVQMFGQS
ncbi:hypothetical protein HA050_11845 [Iodobacter sp. HSC-16F04]|uniref:Uncharacterized protein n=1 Tax=Iodobacter violaceini TaxID=3044271 RepID=A0ABX0KSI5_9NEIS|nr:hypothetical protein [Iodobacter violacea]NHQ86811.1 hypothetical protein [Iodobacter violacea]